MSINSLIAVAVPAYSRPVYLSKLVETIPETVRVFVSDNASSLKGQNLRLGGHVSISHADTLIPMFSNWNRALSLVDGECTHVLIPSDDDLYVSSAFDRIYHFITAYPDVDIFIFGCDLVDELGNVRAGYLPNKFEILAAGKGFNHFFHGVDARMPGVVFRKDFLDRIGAFDDEFKLTAADSDLIQRALLLGRSLFVPEVVGLYRVWAGSLTHSRQATDEWMNEIDIWTDKIVKLIKMTGSVDGGGSVSAKYKDEIIASNLLAGARGLLSRGEFELAKNFLGRHATPRSANFRTKIRLALCRFSASKRRTA